MTARPDAPEPSAAERQRVDRIEAAPAAAESWFIRKIVANELRAAADEAHAEAYTERRLPWEVIRARAAELDPQ